jgi:CRP-like cAMP-binding protein
MRDLPPLGLRRMLRLRQFPLFETVDLDELATIAENLVEQTIPAGTVIATAGTRLHGIHLVLDGTIETRPRGHTWQPHQVFGALEVFANRDVVHTAVAKTDLQTLHVSSADLGEVLEDNFGVLVTALRELAGRLLTVAPVHTVAPAQARTVLAAQPPGPLGLVERLILLRQQLPFAGARLQALATLAHACDEVSWPAGTVIVRAGEPATSAYVLIEGAAIATRGRTSYVVDAGSSIGHLEALAGVQHGATIHTTQPVRALRSDASAILDVLEDHTDVGLAMMATFAGALLDATPQLN